MPGTRIGIEVDDADVREGLRRLIAVLDRPRAEMAEIGSLLESSTLYRFEREREPSGKPWLASARAVAEGGQTLTDSGRLRASITHNVTDGGRAVEVGSNLIYAAIHQFGGQAGRGRKVTIPARPFLGIGRRDRDGILRIVGRALERAAS